MNLDTWFSKAVDRGFYAIENSGYDPTEPFVDFDLGDGVPEQLAAIGLALANP